MTRSVFSIALFVIASAFVATSASAQTASINQANKPAAVRFVRAYVIDDRLSALRSEADIQSVVIKRLSLARTVYVLQTRNGDIAKNGFYRIATSRHTRGWIHRSAIAVANRAGEDQKVMSLIESRGEEIDRLTLCRLLIDRFPRSPLLARALLAMGKEAERIARAISPRARRRLSSLDEKHLSAPIRDYYLSDTALDRCSRLRIRFNFDERTSLYTYDGQAYREVIKKFPASDEARQARRRLDQTEQKIARHGNR
ncbi:MAG: SH3 domain-containing protein [Acidobacteriota bacterium]